MAFRNLCDNVTICEYNYVLLDIPFPGKCFNGDIVRLRGKKVCIISKNFDFQISAKYMQTCVFFLLNDTADKLY